MTSQSTKLLTIITESALETKLLDDLDHLGAPGYTVSNARGRGHRGRRDGNWLADSNIRIEVICEEELALKISQHIEEIYYQNFAMISFVSDVTVLRPDKFSKRKS